MTLSALSKVTVCTLAFGVATEIAYHAGKKLFNLFKNERGKNRSTAYMTKVLFFPDTKVACLDNFTLEDGCKNMECRFCHEDNSLSALYQTLSSCKVSLDVCVFVITCSDLVSVLIRAHGGGIPVRVITDSEQVDVPGSQVWRLRKEGIAVRTDNSSFFMHHKFVVVDQTLLVNGSFNWTRQAITGNKENLMITSDQTVVQSYIAEFNELWASFKPC